MPAIIFPEWLKQELPNFVCWYNVSSASFAKTNCPIMGVVMVT